MTVEDAVGYVEYLRSRNYKSPLGQMSIEVLLPRPGRIAVPAGAAWPVMLTEAGAALLANSDPATEDERAVSLTARKIHGFNLHGYTPTNQAIAVKDAQSTFFAIPVIPERPKSPIQEQSTIDEICDAGLRLLTEGAISMHDDTSALLPMHYLEDLRNGLLAIKLAAARAGISSDRTVTGTRAIVRDEVTAAFRTIISGIAEAVRKSA